MSNIGKDVRARGGRWWGETPGPFELVQIRYRIIAADSAPPDGLMIDAPAPQMVSVVGAWRLIAIHAGKGISLLLRGLANGLLKGNNAEDFEKT